ncbi:MAG: bifunctional biotin--[acetyl-CoA-carboxylase] ligase/biotin operon repressor BirA [Acidiferrobacterales bacterium]
MTTRGALLRILSDGNFHSGTDIGCTLGVPRTAVSRAVAALSAVGMDIHRVSGRGYRLAEAFEPLDHKRIVAALGADAASVCPHVEVKDEVESTNFELLRTPGDIACGQVCIAEAQTGGRGRRGRGWVATPYANLMLSMAWRFEGGVAATAGLSLAAGVAAVRTLRDFGIDQVGLKWPNDLLWDGRKLGGLLIDLRGEAAGPCIAVAGIGINVRIAPRDALRIDQPWADLAAVRGGIVDRNRLAALLIRNLAQMFASFEHAGLVPFREEWGAWHRFERQSVRITGAHIACDGVVEGIDANGALLVRDNRGELRAFHSGEVSLRPIDQGKAMPAMTPQFGEPRS